MRRLIPAVAAAVGLIAAALPAAAHFQSIYAPDYVFAGAREARLKLVFWHPFISGPDVDMPRPEHFYAVNRGQQIDLMPTLQETVFHGPRNDAVAYDAAVPLDRAGDYVVVLVGGLYFDASVGGYVQQFAKAVLNRDGGPPEWSRPVPAPFALPNLAAGIVAAPAAAPRLPTEIIPMTRPYNVLAGSTFTGRLMREGEPLPFWNVEIIYLSAEPDMATGTVGEPSVAPPAGGSLVVVTDEEGIFTVGVPRAGFWGFGALGSGPRSTAPDGRPLSQDAILWIQARDFR